VILSVHTHNDRGCAVAAAELALLAGAERVEGTLFGNGERTGNVDLVTLAMNLASQGVDPGLDLHDLPGVVRVVEECNQMPVPARHPYAGELVFTAFSGSHQDAIHKGLNARGPRDDSPWEVPYLPIDPADIGRAYEPVIRINSQSGKSGVSFVLERDHGFRVPKALAIELSQRVQRVADHTGKELRSIDIYEIFEREYLSNEGALALDGFTVDRRTQATADVRATVRSGQKPVSIEGRGTGPIDAFVQAMNAGLGLDIRVVDYSEHALGEGAAAEAIAYVELRVGRAPRAFGVGRAKDIVAASLQAVVRAVNRTV
jgi:2-isopropylmalate synthase